MGSSAQKLVPQYPSSVTVIRSVTPNITTLSAPFKRFGLAKIGGRSTIGTYLAIRSCIAIPCLSYKLTILAVRMTNGSLLVYSPTALTAEARAAVERLGNDVQYLAAPDIEHHLYLSDWAKAFPGARVLGVEGLPEKREKDPATRGTPFATVFTEKNKAGLRVDDAFHRDFEAEYVGAHANRELALLYRPERTLLQADLIFDLPAREQYSRSDEDPTAGIFTRLFTSVFHTQGHAMAQRRFIWYMASSGDRKGFAESMKRIDGWDFDRIIPCHGDVTETGGKGLFRKVMEWHLQDKSS